MLQYFDILLFPFRKTMKNIQGGRFKKISCRILKKTETLWVGRKIMLLLILHYSLLTNSNSDQYCYKV